ncbi:unnamed protein product [Amaranthus hypochondriacus]
MSNNGSSNSFNTTPNFDNLLLQSLMNRLQLGQNQNQQQHQIPLSASPPFLSKSFEDLLLDAVTNGGRFSDFSFSDEDDDDDQDFSNVKTQLSKEESRLEKELIKIILSGNTETLKPNSGQAVSIGEHHVCVGFHEENGSEYRVWEWHGHIMLFDDENGYTPEYIYGNYFERLMSKAKKDKEEESEKKAVNMGLKELIEGGDSGDNRVLHQIRVAASSGVPKDSSEN